MDAIYRRLIVLSAHLWPEALKLQSYACNIEQAAKAEDIDPNLLLGVLLLERMNRGKIHHLIEHMCVAFLPSYVIRNDCSLGIAQIRPSTAEMVTKIPRTELIHNIMNDNYNIELCASLLHYYASKIGMNNTLMKENIFDIAQLYTTGRLQEKLSYSVIMYAELLWQVVNHKLFSHLIIH